jgi:hypothetical protein
MMDDSKLDEVEAIGKIAMNNFLHHLCNIKEPVSVSTLVCTITAMVVSIVDFIEANSKIPNGKLMKDIITKLKGIDDLVHPVIKRVDKGDMN